MTTSRFRKIPWAAAFILVLLAATLVLSFTPDIIGGPEAARRLMFYWLVCGVPLAALSFAAWAGSAAGRAEPPAEPFKLIVVLAAGILGASALALAAWAVIDFAPPEKVSWWLSAEDLFSEYALDLIYLSLYGFTLSYWFKNSARGAALAAAGLASVMLPLLCISVFQQLFLQLVPMVPLLAATAFAAAACSGVSLKLLAERGAGQERPAARPRVLFFLLLLPTLISISSLALLDLKAKKVTMSGECRLYFTDRFGNTLGDAALVQKPFTGELFLIDGAGRRAEIAAGGTFAGFPLPRMRNNDAMAAKGKDGNVWLLYAPSTSTALLASGGLRGFGERAAIRYQDRSSIFLMGGKEPGLIMSHYDKNDSFAALPYDRKELKWKKTGDTYLMSKKADAETPVAFFSGGTLSHGKDKWILPGARKYDKNWPIKGYLLRGGPAFMLQASIEGEDYTYLCRSGAKPQLIWPKYYPGLRGPFITPRGMIWTRSSNLSTKDSGLYFLIVDEDGKGLPPYRLPDDVMGTGVDSNKIIPLRAAGNSVWFNAGGKYLLKVDASGAGKPERWRLPSIAERPIMIFGGSPGEEDYYKAVTPVGDGIIVAALDGVYFMDWAGNSKKIY